MQFEFSSLDKLFSSKRQNQCLILKTFESSLGSRRMQHIFTLLRKNRWVRFGFGGLTVLVASGGDQVSFYTTVGGVDDLQHLRKVCCTILDFKVTH